MLPLILAASSAPPARVHEDDSRPAVHAEDKRDEDEDDEEEEEGVQPNSPIVVTARRLDAARTEIDAELGATAYSLNNETIEDRPGGETGSIGHILTQTPGVTLSRAGLRIRGSPGVQVRINNVIVPEAISDPADRLSSRFAETTRMITGTLPAQFGFAPGGVVSVKTKNGLYQHGGQAELFGGTRGMVEPALEWAGSAGPSSLFASGSYETGRSYIIDRGTPAKDRRREFGGLAFADHVLDSENRLSAIVGGSIERNSYGPTSLGPGREQDRSGFLVGTIQHSTADFTLQASLFSGLANSRADFGTDRRERRSSIGTQVDASYRLGETDTVRFGLLVDRRVSRATGPGPSTHANRTSVDAYVQDELDLTRNLTVNAGLRVGWLHGLRASAALEPRASIVWTTPAGFSIHAGYARYAAAAPVGDVASSTGLPDERDDYLDAGAQQRIGAFTLGIDGYWRSARNLIVERQVPGDAAPSAFAFERGRFRGVELSATYGTHSLDAWANVSVSRSRARTIMGGASLFPEATIAAADGQWIPLAADRPVSGSAGFTWHAGKLDLGADMIAGSGAVTRQFAAADGSARAPAYADLGLSFVYHLRIAGHPADIRADLLNVTNSHYLTNDSANLEGGWTRRDVGRAVLIGIEQAL